MRSTKRRPGFCSQMCRAVVTLCLSMPAFALTATDLTRERCLAGGYWYGFYRDKSALRPICLKLPEVISGKMLDSNGDGVVDNTDALSSGVTFVGENPTDNGTAGVGEQADGDVTPADEKSGGSRRIMWRQIQ